MYNNNNKNIPEASESSWRSGACTRDSNNNTDDSNNKYSNRNYYTTIVIQNVKCPI